MSLVHCEPPKARSSKHARHVHLSSSTNLRNSTNSKSSRCQESKSVILSEKKISRAKIDKLVHLHARWTCLREFKIRKMKRNRRGELQKRMKYQIISQRYLRKLSAETKA